MVTEDNIQRAISLDPLLRIARWHLDQIENTETTTPELASLVVDHATVATVFSAAAVEHRLSNFLCSPTFYMEEEGPRRFIGRLLTRYALCANDSETLTSPGISVEGGERCLSHGEPEEGESPATAGRGRQGGRA